MAATDAVRATAVARREVRNSLERLEYHLGRGSRGLRGVQREIRFLDALHRQVVRVGGQSVGRAYTGRARVSFGEKAARAMSHGNTSTIGRMKSSLLADFAADGMQAARDTVRQLDEWVWTANASACPTCLNEHGSKHPGNQVFTPMHPSCLCVPQPVSAGVRPLTDSELVAMQRRYGDPRYASAVEKFEAGTISRSALARVESVNRSRAGLRAVAEHSQKSEVVQTSLGPSGAPAPSQARLADPDLDPSDTFDYYRQGGEWSSDRAALHEKIMEDFFKGLDSVDDPVAYMTGGGPASGKSTMLESGQVNFPSSKVSAHIDPDAFKKYLPEYENLVAASDPRAAAFAHRESSHLSDMALRRAAERRMNLVYDGTGDSGIDKLASRVAEMRAGGGRVVGEYATLDTELAVRLAMQRAEATGRMVPEAVITGKHADVTDSFLRGLGRGLWDEVRLWDTNVYQQPRLIGELVEGRFVVSDVSLWDSFVAKGTLSAEEAAALIA